MLLVSTRHSGPAKGRGDDRLPGDGHLAQTSNALAYRSSVNIDPLAIFHGEGVQCIVESEMDGRARRELFSCCVERYKTASVHLSVDKSRTAEFLHIIHNTLDSACMLIGTPDGFRPDAKHDLTAGNALAVE